MYNPVRIQTYVIKKYKHKRLGNYFTFKSAELQSLSQFKILTAADIRNERLKMCDFFLTFFFYLFINAASATQL